MHKNLALLHQMQAQRKQLEREETTTAQGRVNSATPARQPIAINNFSAAAPQNGFVFANSTSAPETPMKSPCKVIPMSPGLPEALSKDHKNEAVNLSMAQAA
jgi:hypothetical protein